MIKSKGRRKLRVTFTLSECALKQISALQKKSGLDRSTQIGMLLRDELPTMKEYLALKDEYAKHIPKIYRSK